MAKPAQTCTATYTELMDQSGQDWSSPVAGPTEKLAETHFAQRVTSSFIVKVSA